MQRHSVQPFDDLDPQRQGIITKLDSVKGQIELSPEYQERPAKPNNSVPLRPPPLPSERFYVYLDSEVKGPYLREQLVALCDTGTIAADTQCCLEGTERWTRYIDL